MNVPDAVVSIKNLSKVFGRGGLTALQDISLEVGRGEFVSLIGPSGCAFNFEMIEKRAGAAVYRSDLAKKAVAALKKQGVDVFGKKWKKAKVTLTEGGK